MLSLGETCKKIFFSAKPKSEAKTVLNVHKDASSRCYDCQLKNGDIHWSEKSAECPRCYLAVDQTQTESRVTCSSCSFVFCMVCGGYSTHEMNNQHYMHTDILSMPYSFQPVGAEVCGKCGCEERRANEKALGRSLSTYKWTCLASDLNAVNIGFASSKVSANKYLGRIEHEEEHDTQQVQDVQTVCRQLMFLDDLPAVDVTWAPQKNVRPEPEYDLLDFDVRLLFEDDDFDTMEYIAPGAPLKSSKPFRSVLFDLDDDDEPIRALMFEEEERVVPGAPMKSSKPFQHFQYNFDDEDDAEQSVRALMFEETAPKVPGAPKKTPVRVERTGKPKKLMFGESKSSTKKRKISL